MRDVPAPDPASSPNRTAAASARLGAVPHRDDLDVLIPTRDRASALAVTLAGLLSQDLTARLVLAGCAAGRSRSTTARARAAGSPSSASTCSTGPSARTC
jgi:hypothetical protein